LLFLFSDADLFAQTKSFIDIDADTLTSFPISSFHGRSKSADFKVMLTAFQISIYVPATSTTLVVS
jgi:hypothetical protein